MEPRFFYVIIDTTHSATARNMARGILNTYIIKAYDENHAKQMVLRTMAPNIAMVVDSSVFVYDLDDIMYNIDLVFGNKNVLPMFSFIPMNGTRPQKVLNIKKRPVEANESTVVVPDEEKIITQEKQPKVEVETKPKPHPQSKTVVPPKPPRNPREVRSNSFRQNDYEPMGQVDDKVDSEKASILAALGVHKSVDGSDEGHNPRINASTGRNLDQSIVRPTQGPKNSLTKEQLELLNSIGADTGGSEVTDEPVNEDAAWVPDDDLNQIDGEVLTDDRLIEIQNEFKEVAEDTGVEIGESVPMPDIDVSRISMGLSESNIDTHISSKKVDYEGEF